VRAPAAALARLPAPSLLFIPHPVECALRCLDHVRWAFDHSLAPRETRSEAPAAALARLPAPSLLFIPHPVECALRCLDHVRWAFDHSLAPRETRGPQTHREISRTVKSAYFLPFCSTCLPHLPIATASARGSPSSLAFAQSLIFVM